ncbi:MAG: glycine cleavage system H-protein subunit [Chaenotheca gracillima]|nr:MAG: glycine cleavage system H-protein subunit [Chaenotheca gracillima]
MAAATAIAIYSRRGTIYYSPPALPTPLTQDLGTSHAFFRGRRARSQYIRISAELTASLSSGASTKASRRRSRVPEKLAGSRDSAKRFLRSVISSQSSGGSATPSTSSPGSSSRNASPKASRAEGPAHPAAPPPMPSNGGLNGLNRPTVGGPISGMVSRPSLVEDVRTASARSVNTTSSSNSGTQKSLGEEKPVASGNGISAYITLAEPVLFLQGFEQTSDSNNPSTAMLRGSLVIKVAKSAKLKSIYLNFKGKARTEWPEGIPPKKTEFFEEQELNRHTWPFFNAQFPTAEGGFCADVVKLAKAPGSSSSTLHVPSSGRLAFDQFARSASPAPSGLTSKDQKRLSLQVNQSRSFGKGESASGGPTIAQKGYRTFHPGDYIYNFELPLDSRLPETIDVELGSVKYDLDVLVERAGAFRTNLFGSKPVTLIRAPAESSLEQVEPIAISRNWEDQLHYDIVISGKSFPLGSQVPIAFKLTPLAKVQCHRIKVYVTENIEYYCREKRVHRLEPTRKVHLFEKRADGPSSSTFPGSSMRILAGGGVEYDYRQAAAQGDENVTRDMTNLLGDLEGEHNVGPTEMEFSVQLPSCSSLRELSGAQRLHFDTTYQNIQVHHWIKIVMRLSKPDASESGKRRHFEISIDSPFHILSCQATQANTSLPAYSSPDAQSNGANGQGAYLCGCPGAQRRPDVLSSIESYRPEAATNHGGAPNASAETVLARPAAAHLEGARSDIQRPMHMLRNPSFNPPAFDAEMPPPALITPPPHYDSIVGEGEGLADYFARLADEVGDEEGVDDDRSSSRGRVNLPLTPGGRINRSMDERRTWAPLNTAT